MPCAQYSSELILRPAEVPYLLQFDLKIIKSLTEFKDMSISLVPMIQCKLSLKIKIRLALSFALKPGGLILFASPKKYAKTPGKIMLLPSCHRTPAILPSLRT